MHSPDPAILLTIASLPVSEMRKKDRELNERVIRAIDELQSRLESSELIDPKDFDFITDAYAWLDNDARRRENRPLAALGIIDRGLKSNLDVFRNLFDVYPKRLKEHNEALVRIRAVEAGRCINPVEGRDLDGQQLAAIAYDVGSRLVVAGAGTGKTTTVVGLVKYLLYSGKALPEEILALSFTNASVDDLRRRITSETGQRTDVNTFHRLGMRIIASVDGTVPKVSNIKLDEFIAEHIRLRRTDAEFVRNLNEFIAYDFESISDEDRFGDSSELVEYLRENPLITLRGERVKSFGEADIANCLAMNGVPYAYEEPYCVDTANSRYGHYHPDFHITGTDIYIEYFGTDRDGNVAGFMTDRNPNAAEEYRNGIEWKRKIHSENGTRLIELYSYERTEGTLLDDLEYKLRSMEVKFVPESPERIFERTIGSDEMTLRSISSSFATCLLLIKGCDKPWAEAYPKSCNMKDRRPLKRLESVLRPIYYEYQSALKERGEIDFEDMLNLAARYVREGRYVHPYKYVIVDEYQDLSLPRYVLLRSLRTSKDCSLFCVGDDWQSIFRFNGCDVSYILDFEKHWGPSVICKIEKTYRFSGDLLKKSGEFISRSKRQIQKDLVGTSGKDSRVFFIS